MQGSDAVQLFGVRLVGLTADNGKKLLLSIAFVALVALLSWGLGALARFLFGRRGKRAAFWTSQGIHVVSALLTVIALCSIWFNDPARLATALGLITAGLAFALQRVVTALAAYLVILRGKTFSVGDRIVMGGVRGDVVELGFMQTTIMEMGQAPAEQAASPAMWVRARQYTGRLVTITNDKIFDTPVYNYTRDFPFIWEEMQIPVPYDQGFEKAEQVLLAAARKYTLKSTELGEEALAELERRYSVKREQFEPAVYVHMTDNWIELSLRFLVSEHGVREVKDKISRELLQEFKLAGISVASGTYQIVGMPDINVKLDHSLVHDRERLGADAMADTK